MRISVFVRVFLGIFVLATWSRADIPKVINYQGKVTDTGGTPVDDGSYQMRFRIINAPAGGTVLWDSDFQTVSVNGGVFNVLLGESPQPGIDLDFGKDYWLLVTFEGVNQTPRQRLASAGYTYMASGLVPGTVVAGNVTTGSSAALSGINTSTDSGTGLFGACNSPGGSGVLGLAAATDGFATGVFGQTSASSGAGVHGFATATTGANFGIRGSSHSTDGIGVLGWANAATGYTNGVYGISVSTQGRGVHGYADASSGTNYGVYGKTNSPSGYGGYFDGRGYFSGTVGIGTTSPRAQLDVRPTFVVTGTEGDRLFRVRQNSDGSCMILVYDGSDHATVKINGGTVEGSTFFNQGNVGIGTTDPGYKLQVGESGDGTEARANAWNTFSSRAYKRNIEPLASNEYKAILERLTLADVVRYQLKDDQSGAIHIGLIAEDAPRDIVTSDGKALSMSDYSAFLLAAIKAQQAEMAELRQRLVALEQE